MGTDSSIAPLCDLFGRRHTYLRVAVTDRCNLRCTYCMPASGHACVPCDDLLTFDEIVRVARVLAKAGVTKVRLTGGEPLVRPAIEDLVASLSRISGIRTVVLTTNGVLLERHAGSLRTAGLNGVNVSLDSLQPARFARIAGHEALSDVLAGIDAALAAGLTSVKVNMVVMAGLNDDEIPDFVELARTRPLHVRFIEYMPFPGNCWRPNRLVPYQAILASARSAHELIPFPSTSHNPVTKEYRIEGFLGRIGFITPMTGPFCDGCTRLRLTADGALKGCLFHPPECGLRDALRSDCTDEEIMRLVRSALRAKPEQHGAAHDAQPGSAARSMIQIGG